jgi:phosphatidate phosphatase APP1
MSHISPDQVKKKARVCASEEAHTRYESALRRASYYGRSLTAARASMRPWP